MPDWLVDTVAISLLVVFAVNLVALGYVQYASRPLLKAIAGSGGPRPIRERAADAATFGSRKRTRALRQLRRDPHYPELDAALQARVQRYFRVVTGMYATFGLLIVAWLIGLVLQGPS